LKCQGEILEPRRNFAYDVLGRSFFVHGGLNSHGKTLGDVWELTLGEWENVDLLQFSRLGQFLMLITSKQ
jgi:hypothetical protein